MEPYAVYYEALVLQERGKLAQDISRKSEIDRQALQENLMVNSVDCSINIEQGQKSDLIFVDSTVDVIEEADEHGFRGVAFTESRLIHVSWQKVMIMGELGGNNLLNNLRHEASISCI